MNVLCRYEDLKQKVTERRDAFQRFVAFLETQTAWLTSPASTRFHLNIEGGLLIHSVGVTENALRIKDILAPAISDESVVISSLLHDIGKVGYPGKPYYLPNDNSWEVERRGITYKINSEVITMNLAVRSLFLVSQYIPLTEQEAQSIVAHDGIYPLKGGVNNLDYHHKECQLLMIIQFADKWTAAVDEEERS